MTTKVVEVEVGDEKYRVHSLKADQQYLYFNGIAAVKDLYGKLQHVFDPTISHGNGSGPTPRFEPGDFAEPAALIAAMADLAPEQVAGLDLPDWWGLLSGVLELDRNFLAARPASPKSLP